MGGVPKAEARPPRPPAVDDDTSDGDDDGDGTRKKKKPKEADTIVLPPLPTVSNFRNWRTQVRDVIMAASGRGDKILSWVLEIEDAGTTLATLADPGAKLRSLDQKLKDAVNRIASTSIQRELLLQSEEQIRLRRTLKGRQALKIVYDDYKLNPHLGSVYSMRDLALIKVQDGGGNLEKFYHDWCHCLSGFQDPPPKKTIETMFVEELRKAHSVLGYDIGVYDRAKEGLMNDRMTS
jgi:hypothetical protein